MALAMADWQEVATENRVRIQALEVEMERQRQRTRELSTTVSTIALLAQEVKQLAGEVLTLGERVERASRRALERPTADALSATAGWLSAIIAIAAIILATR